MAQIRTRLPQDSFEALEALVRVLGSSELTRVLFSSGDSPRVKLSRKRPKKRPGTKRGPRRV